MTILLSSHFITLHSQHCLTHADLLKIYQLATLEEMDECIDSFSFEEFLGLVVYMLVTTQSKDSREQLCGLLPKFGSAAVLPLLKVLSHQDSIASEKLSPLIHKSLHGMEGYALIIGLDQVLHQNLANDLKTLALEMLRQRLQLLEQAELSLLPQMLSDATLEMVKDLLVVDVGLPIYIPTLENEEDPSPVSELAHNFFQPV